MPWKVEKHGLNFTEMAAHVGISRAALRIACFKEGKPGKKTIPQLAAALNRTEAEIKSLIAENNLRQIYENNDDYLEKSN